MARRKIGRTNVPLRVLIWGKEGSRKSNTAIQLAMLKNIDGTPKKVLLLDLEYKSIEGYNEMYLAKHGVNLDNICEIRTRDLKTIKELIDRFTMSKPIPKLDENDNIIKNEYELDGDGKPFIADSIIIDSLSVLSDLFIEGRQVIVDRRTNLKIVKDGIFGDEKELMLDNSGLQLLDHSKIKTKALKLIRDLQAISGKDICYIARGKDAKKTSVVNGKMEIIDLGYEIMDATAFKFLPFEVSLEVYTKNNNDVTLFTVKKDCTGVHAQNEVSSDFSLLDYNEFINNADKTEKVTAKKYDENLKTASIFTEDAEEADKDIKLKYYTLICMSAKNNKEHAAMVKDYCTRNKIDNFNQAELISMQDLVEIKKILKI